MSQAVDAMIERWSSDDGFKAELRADPLGAAERNGFALDEDERQALAALDLSLSDEQLSERLNMAG